MNGTLPTILASFKEEGLSVREAAAEHGITVELAHAIWIAEVCGAGGDTVTWCQTCGGQGIRDAAECKGCRGSGRG